MSLVACPPGVSAVRMAEVCGIVTASLRVAARPKPLSLYRARAALLIFGARLHQGLPGADSSDTLSAAGAIRIAQLT